MALRPQTIRYRFVDLGDRGYHLGRSSLQAVPVCLLCGDTLQYSEFCLPVMTLMENEILTSDIRGHRTLATVVFTDCVGFSAKMSADEDRTLDLIRRDLKLMKHVCEQFEGRVLKTTGDGLLMCFSSAVNAVECAIEIQHQMTESATLFPSRDALVHRIGIHLADIFISERDVMGNGVNIAARLQTEAEPGGICISQTVHDVVKSSLQLETKYLGPRELKNILETVPVYKIVLHPEDEISPYTEVALNLQHAGNHLRIRKLLHYVCNRQWESDPARLEALDMQSLVEKLLQLAPSPEQLRNLLESAVKTLSKQLEYSLIADEILSEVVRLCDRSLAAVATSAVITKEVTQLVPPTPVPLPSDLPYGTIARMLQTSAQAERLKKLLFYVCTKQWVSDPGQLNQIDVAEFLSDLHRLAPTPEHLRNLVHTFVQTLNKRAEYIPIANLLVGRMQPLYAVNLPEPAATPQPVANAQATAVAAASESRTDASPYAAIAAALDGESHSLRIKKLLLYACRGQWVSDPQMLTQLPTEQLVKATHLLAPTAEQLATVLNAIVGKLSKPAEYALIATIITTHLSQLYQQAADEPPAQELANPQEPVPVPSAVADQPSIPPTPPEPPPQLDLFDIRLELMKYTNPLRTKILVFAALYHGFHFTSQDWLNLKMHDLDDLLRSLLQTCQVYTELERVLYEAARNLNESNEYIQTAEAVIKCIRPVYIHGRPGTRLNPAPDATHIHDVTRITIDDFDESTRELDQAAEDDYRLVAMVAEEEQTMLRDPALLGSADDPTAISDEEPTAFYRSSPGAVQPTSVIPAAQVSTPDVVVEDPTVLHAAPAQGEPARQRVEDRDPTPTQEAQSPPLSAPPLSSVEPAMKEPDALL